MRDHLSRKTLVPAHRTFHHGRSTIVGGLVVLSVFMLVLGVPSTPAQTGQDARCADYAGQAKDLCTAAVSEGCFDGVQSQECDELTSNWTERCRDRSCLGRAPWVCPCTTPFGSAADLHERFLALEPAEPLVLGCLDNAARTLLRHRRQGAFRPSVEVVAEAPPLFSRHGECSYTFRDDGGLTIQSAATDLEPSNLEACRQDIRALIDLLDCQGDKELTFLDPAIFWVGLKNSDDQGTRFDLRTELYINGLLVSEGITRCITGVTRNPSNAKEVAVPFSAITNGAFVPGDRLSLKVLTRIGTNPDDSKCPGHNNAVGLRLYYDAVSRASRFGAQIAPNPPPPTNFFLHVNAFLVLDDSAPTASTAQFKDSASVNFAGGNPWKEIGTWIMILP